MSPRLQLLFGGALLASGLGLAQPLPALPVTNPKPLPKDEAFSIWQDWIELELWAQGLKASCENEETEGSAERAKVIANDISQHRKLFEEDCLVLSQPNKLYCPGERLRLVAVHELLLNLIDGAASCAAAESRLQSLASRKLNYFQARTGAEFRYSSNPRKQRTNSDNEPLFSPALTFEFAGSRGEGTNRGFGLSTEGEVERAARTLVNFSTKADAVFSLGAFEFNPDLHAANEDKRLRPLNDDTQNLKRYGASLTLHSTSYKYFPQLHYQLTQQSSSQNAYSGVNQKAVLGLLTSGNIFWESRIFVKYERFRASDLALDPTTRSLGAGARFSGKLRWGSEGAISLALVEWAQRAHGNNVYPELSLSMGASRLPTFAWGYRSQRIRFDRADIEFKLGPERTFLSSETFIARVGTKFQWRSGRTLVPFHLSAALEDSKDPGVKRRAWTTRVAFVPRYFLSNQWSLDALASLERSFAQGEAQDYRRWASDGSYSDFQLRLGSSYGF